FLIGCPNFSSSTMSRCTSRFPASRPPIYLVSRIPCQKNVPSSARSAITQPPGRGSDGTACCWQSLCLRHQTAFHRGKAAKSQNRVGSGRAFCKKSLAKCGKLCRLFRFFWLEKKIRLCRL